MQMFIDRPDYGKNEKNDQEANDDKASDSMVKVIVAKNRNGSTATIDFMFQKHISRFVEMDNTFENEKKENEG